MFWQRHNHHEESHGSLAATIDEQRQSSSISAQIDAYDRQICEAAKLFTDNNLEATTARGRLRRLASAEAGQESRLELMVTSSDSPRQSKQSELVCTNCSPKLKCSRQLNIDRFSEVARGFQRTSQLTRSHSEPVLLQDLRRFQQTGINHNRRSTWHPAKLLSLRKTASEKHERTHFGDQNQAAESSGGSDDGELGYSQLHRRRGIELWRSLKNLWHVGYFWFDFVHYQLETWCQLAGQVSSTSSYVRRLSPIVQQQPPQDHHQGDKMSESYIRWPNHQPESSEDNQQRRPFISATNRSHSEAGHYYRAPAMDQLAYNDLDGNLNYFHTNYHANADFYIGGPQEEILVNPPPRTPQPDLYANLTNSRQFKQGQLRHQHQLAKMNTLDGSPMASCHRRRAPLVSQHTMDSGRPSTPMFVANSNATHLLCERYSTANPSNGPQTDFRSSPAADFQLVDADDFYHLYDDSSRRPGGHHHHRHHLRHHQRPLNACSTRQPHVLSVGSQFEPIETGAKQPTTSQPATKPTNFSSSTNNPFWNSQSLLLHHHHHQQQQHEHQAQCHRARLRQTAIGSDSELHFQQQHSINLGGSASRQQVPANKKVVKEQSQTVRSEPRSGTRLLQRQASAAQASPASGQQQQQCQHQFATDLTSSSSRIQQRSTTINARNSKKSPNLVKLSLEGAKRRLGFKQESCRISQLSIQRSEEVVPYDSELERLQDLTVDNSLADITYSRHIVPESSCSPSPFHWSLTGSGASRSPFIEGLGPGQVYSRQALVSPDIGDLMLTLCNRHGALDITVIRARRLHLKLGTTQKPSPYVKVYLIKDKKCIAKWKTVPAIQTLDPDYQQSFIYRGDFTSCAVQIIVWGDYGRKDRKSFMGIVQICTDDLELSSTITGWYKLFNAPSMINLFNSSKQMRQQMLPKRIGDTHSKSR